MPEQNATPDVADVVSHPEKYGFVWLENQKVEKDGMVLSPVPLVKHNDVDLLRKTFGDSFFTESMDGTSRHVTNQRIVRDAKWSERSIKVDALKVLIVQNMLGQKSARKRTVIIETKFSLIMPDGEFKTFDSKEQAVEAYKQALVAKAEANIPE